MTRFLGFGLFVCSGITLSLGSSQSQVTVQEKAEAPSHELKATVEGLVRDVACPIQNLEATATHLSMKCLRACAKNGSPLVILTKDGELYLPISDKMPDRDQRQKLMPFLGKYVRATGTVYERRRVSTTLRQVLAKFSEFFMCWVFHEEISRQDRLATTIANSVDPQHPHFCLPSRAFRCLFPPEAVPDWKPVC